jgi:hypothetical protein
MVARLVLVALVACGHPAPKGQPSPPPQRDAAPVTAVDAATGVMDDLVALAGGRLKRGDDAACAGETGRPHFYGYESNGDGELVKKLMERCTAIGPHRGMNVARWCCPAAAPTGADACAADADCTRGYHAADLNSAGDCGCRVCPTVPQTSAAAARRDEQYGRLCTPGVTAAGVRCPVASCVAPGPTICRQGMCVSP